MKVIKKYKNRRLYDTETSQYITFDDIKTFIKEGVDFEIRESKTEENLTASTLLQVLIDLEGKNSSLVPIPLLKQLIRYTEHPMHEQLSKMLEKSMTLFNETQAAASSNDFFDMMAKNTEAAFKSWQEMMFNPGTQKKE